MILELLLHIGVFVFIFLGLGILMLPTGGGRGGYQPRGTRKSKTPKPTRGSALSKYNEDD